MVVARSRWEREALVRAGRTNPLGIDTSDAAWQRAEEKVAVENHELRRLGVEPAGLSGKAIHELLETKAFNVSVVGTTGRPAYPRQSIANWIEEGYRRNELVFACIAYIAKAGNEVTIRAAERKISGGHTLLAPEHPLNAIVRRPRPGTSEAWHLAEMDVLKHVAGNAIAFKRRSAIGLPFELHWLRTDRIKKTVDGNDQIIGYTYVVNGVEFGIRPRDIVHHRYMPDPADPPWGLSPIAAMARAVTADNAATDFVASFFANAAVPYGLLTTDRVLTTPEADEIANRWTERYAGMEGWNRPAVLGSGARYERLGLDMEEMAMPDLRNLSESRICMDLGVPPILVGAKVGLDRSTFSNYAEARESFWEETKQPDLNGWADDLTESVALEYGDRYFYLVDYSAVSALQGKLTARRMSARELWNDGLASLDEAREIAGLPTIGGDVGKMRKQRVAEGWISQAELEDDASADPADEPEPPVGALPAPRLLPAPADDNAPAPASATRAPEAAALDGLALAYKKRNSRAAGREYARQLGALRNAYQRTAIGRLEAYFDALGDRVVSRAQTTTRLLRGTGKAAPDADAPKALSSEDRAAARRLLRASDHRELERIVSAYFDQIGGDAVRLGNLVYDLGIVYGDSPARMRTLARAARASTQIVDTVTDDIGRTIAKANRRGWNVAQLIDGDEVEAGLRGVFGKGDPTLPGFHDAIQRAERIASTGFTTASNVSAANAFRESGIAQVEIADGSGLGDVCDEVNGQVWTIDEYEANELEHPNCTRIGIPILPADAPTPTASPTA
jgi:HK97 family phage portal protein